jgi:hypothetical protein
VLHLAVRCNVLQRAGCVLTPGARQREDFVRTLVAAALVATACLSANAILVVCVGVGLGSVLDRVNLAEGMHQLISQRQSDWKGFRACLRSPARDGHEIINYVDCITA